MASSWNDEHFSSRTTPRHSSSCVLCLRFVGWKVNNQHQSHVILSAHMKSEAKFEAFFLRSRKFHLFEMSRNGQIRLMESKRKVTTQQSRDMSRNKWNVNGPVCLLRPLTGGAFHVYFLRKFDFLVAWILKGMLLVTCSVWERDLRQKRKL